jgi:HEAT repeat protein
MGNIEFVELERSSLFEQWQKGSRAMSNAMNKWKEKIVSRVEFDRLEALDKIPSDLSSDVLNAVLMCVDDESELVRQAVAEALSLFDDDKARTALKGLAKDKDQPLVKQYALSSLGTIGGIEELKLLIEYFQSEMDRGIRVHIVTGMALAARRIAMNNLSEILTEDEAVLKSSAIMSLLFFYQVDELRDVLDKLEQEVRANPENDDLINAHIRLSRIQQALQQA